MKKILFVILWMIIYTPASLAQTPHEFFKFRFLEPPLESDVQTTVSVKLDANTRAPDKTVLEENFDPPVGAHKRVKVYNAIEYSEELVVLPVQDLWERVQPSKIENASDVVRHALIYAPVQADSFFILPTDSSRMKIVSFQAFDDDGVTQELTLWWSEASGRYAISSSRSGVYRLELMTASPKLLLEEADSEAIHAAARQPVPEQRQMEAVRTLVAQYPELQEIMRSPSALSQLAEWFRGFEAQSLKESTTPVFERVLEQKRGICRHRAMAFMAIALAFGYEVRMVTNEAHAFVEVYINKEWRFVDLGGQTTELAVTSPFDETPVALEEVTQARANSIKEASFSFTKEPPQIYTRDVPITLEGQLSDRLGLPIPNTIVTLGIDAPHVHTILTSGMTDESGHIQFVFRIPPSVDPGQASLWMLSEAWLIDF